MKIVLMTVGVLGVFVGSSSANSSSINIFDQELHKVKYSYSYAAAMGKDGAWNLDDSAITKDETMKTPGQKSPAKAFLLSLAVPGLGQLYYGSKVKSAAFLGVEATAWILHVGWHNDGNQLTDEFEAFNRTHWIQNRYEDYLDSVYGVRDDKDTSIHAQEVSHNLPDTRTQQYYEMTGKYDQFSWGWDDAILYDSVTYNDWGTVPPPAITGKSTTPYSALRFQYEGMRNNANKKFDKADKMLMVALANRVAAALDAFISAKSINNKFRKAGEFSNWKIKPTLLSYNHRRDTPYMKVTYKF